MNGIEKITSRILSEAEAEAAAILEEAEKNAAAVRAEWAEKAEKTEAELLEKGEAEIEQKVQRAGRSARLDAKKAVLALKQEMVGAAYGRALEKILALPRERYAEFLASQAAAAALSGREEVILNSADRAAIGDSVLSLANAKLRERGLPGELTLSKATREMSGGLALKQGAVEVNCTLDSLIELSRSALDAEVAGILFR